MVSPTAYWKSLQSWAGRHWPLLSALGHVLALAILFGGAALAAYTADFGGPVISLICGAVAVWLVKLFARVIPAIQRVIGRLQPEPGKVATPAVMPGWAFVIYMLLSAALVLTIIRGEETYSPASIGLIAAWAAGFGALDYFFARRNDPGAPSASAIIDDALDRLAEPHRPLLRKLQILAGFVALAGGVGLHAFHSGFADAIAPTVMPIATAIACGALAIVFAWLHVAATLAAQRALIDPWRYVRPEPPSRDLERWPLYLFALTGIALFIAMSFIGQERAAGDIAMSMEGSRFRIEIGAVGLLSLLIGWGGGGYRVLRWFWAKARERAERARARA